MKEKHSEIRIYVACLAAYNNGVLHGAWINAEQSTDEIYACIHEMLKASPIEGAEEYAIHDYEGFEGVSIAEYEDIDHVLDLAVFISEHGRLGAKLLDYYNDIEIAQNAINDQYHGCYRSLADFAEELTEETTQIPENLRYYIDYDAMARDLEISDIMTIETGFEEIHVFWER